MFLFACIIIITTILYRLYTRTNYAKTFENKNFNSFRKFIL
jgi:hypothetical protein